MATRASDRDRESESDGVSVIASTNLAAMVV